MRWLQLAEVLELHRRLIDQSGGTAGIRDLGLLEASLAQPRQTFGGIDQGNPKATSPADLAERLGLIGSFSSAAQGSGATSRGRDHSALLRQKLGGQVNEQRR